MLALRVKQKDGTFYVVSYKAPDLLRRVRFLSRHYQADERPEVKPRAGEEDILAFIRGVEQSDRAFQRGLIQRKVRDILNFYENAQSQPMVPGPVLLYTAEMLDFKPLGDYQTMGNLSEPDAPFIVIDGQHRLAGMRTFLDKHPEEAENVEVPAIVFDGRQEDFAAEMFVIINSTHTRINKSHLVDLMERVTYGTSPEKKWAAWIVTRLYDDTHSPLRYKINKLGGRSKQEKWILQSELFNEVYRLVDTKGKEDDEGGLHRYIATEFGWDRRGHAPELFIDYLRAVESVMGDVWGSKNHMFCTSVTIKALLRVLGDMLLDAKVRKGWRDGEGEDVFASRIAGWAGLGPDFRREGFYERFAAKGQVERVRLIHKTLLARTELD
jgi:DGQHR domain-containing protein